MTQLDFWLDMAYTSSGSFIARLAFLTLHMGVAYTN